MWFHGLPNLYKERIVWCYSQWQPAYTEMLVAVPHIEIIKGIPTALEQDFYFDVNKRNLIVFDDQMTYLVLFKNPRDKLQILTLAKQMYPGKTDFFLNQYKEAV